MASSALTATFCYFFCLGLELRWGLYMSIVSHTTKEIVATNYVPPGSKDIPIHQLEKTNLVFILVSNTKLIYYFFKNNN